MTPLTAFRIVTAGPDQLVLQELPYALAGWIALASGAFLAAFAFLRWLYGLPRMTFFALTIGGTVCMTFGAWLAGLQYEFAFLPPESAVEIRRAWFGRSVGGDRFTYTDPPVADVVTTKRTTHQLVLRFSDGRVKSLGLSTDRPGHEETARLINDFLRRKSVLQ